MRGEVDEDPGAAEQREDDEPEPEDGRVELEVAAQSASDACDHGVGGAALEAPDLGCVCDVLVHASRVPGRAGRVYSASPWSDPQRYPRFGEGADGACTAHRLVSALLCGLRRGVPPHRLERQLELVGA